MRCCFSASLRVALRLFDLCVNCAGPVSSVSVARRVVYLDGKAIVEDIKRIPNKDVVYGCFGIILSQVGNVYDPRIGE